MVIRIAADKERDSVFALRALVFICEQKVPPEIETDEEDERAIHIIAEENGEIVGCARVIITENDAHIGRLAVKKAFRGKGIGSAICKFMIELCQKEGCSRIWLNSQLQAVGFYEKLGFKQKGETFWEAGIEHIEMEI